MGDSLSKGFNKINKDFNKISKGFHRINKDFNRIDQVFHQISKVIHQISKVFHQISKITINLDFKILKIQVTNNQVCLKLGSLKQIKEAILKLTTTSQDLTHMDRQIE